MVLSSQEERVSSTDIGGGTVELKCEDAEVGADVNSGRPVRRDLGPTGNTELANTWLVSIFITTRG